MSVSILSHEKCPVCRGTYSAKNEWKCHFTRPEAVFIRIYSAKHVPTLGHVLSISRSPKTGLTLQMIEAAGIKTKIEEEIEGGTFDYRRYLGQRTNYFLWEHLRERHLDEMKRRSDLPPDSPDYRTIARWGELEKYHRLYLGHFDGRDISEIDYRLVTRYLDDLKDQSGAPASVNLKRKCREVLAATLSWAYRRGDLKDRPDTSRWPEYKLPKRRIVTLTISQQEEIFAAMKGAHPIVRWLLATGERINAARAKKIGDINFLKGEYYHGGAFTYYGGVETYKPFPKVRDRAADANPITDDLRGIIEEAIAGREGLTPEDWLFLNPASGKPYTQKALGSIWWKARKAAGYTASLNEGTRHSWATQRIAEGWAPHQVAMFAGNSGKVVEEKYLRCSADVKRQVIDLVNARTDNTGSKQRPLKKGKL